MAYKFEGRGLAVDKPFRTEIIDPATGEVLKCTVDGKEYTAFLSVLSSDSPKAKAFEAAALDRRLNVMGNRRTTAKDMEAVKVDFLAALTVDWCIVSPDHNLIAEPFSEAAARALYAAPEWSLYRDAADRAIGNRANFTPASPAS